MIEFTASLLHLLLLAAFIVLMARALMKKMYSSNNGNDEKPKPPMAPYGFLKTVEKASTAELPWFLQSIARSPVGTIFRIKLTPFGIGPDFVVIGDARLAQSVLRNSENLKPRFIYKNFEPASRGPSIVSAEGHRWHHVRKAIAPAFSSKHLKRMNATVLEHIQKWVQEDLVPNYVKDESPFDITGALLRQVLKGISIAGFEYNMSDEEVETFLNELEIGLREFHKQSINPIRKLFGPFTSAGQRGLLAVDRYCDFARKVLENYRSLKNPDKGTIISLIANNPNYKSDEERISDIITFYVGGHDSTAYSLAWTLLELAKNQSEQTKLRRALQNTKSDEWKNVPELHYVIKEGLRLHPVFSVIIWKVLKEDIVTNKYTLAKGTIVNIPSLLVHRNKEYMDKPDEFIPSRWIDPSDDLSSAFIPFSLGRRNCVGQYLAYAELYNCLATLVAEYEFSVFEEGTVDFFLTLKPVGMKLIAKKKV